METEWARCRVWIVPVSRALCHWCSGLLIDLPVDLLGWRRRSWLLWGRDRRATCNMTMLDDSTHTDWLTLIIWFVPT